MKKYRGIIVPAVTPLSAPDRIDENAIEPFFEHLISGGVNAVFILGSTGEGPALPLAEQKKFITASARILRGRLPLMTGISGASGAESIGLGEFALEAGADALAAAVPCYFPAASEDEIVHYYTTLAHRFPGRIFVYNMPALTQVAFSAELAVRLLQIDGVAGYKDSCGKAEELEKIIRLLPPEILAEKSLFIGQEHLTLRVMRAGADGGVNGGANVRPELFARLYRAFLADDSSALAAAQAEIEALQSLYGPEPVTSGSVIRGLKHELAHMGLMKNIMAFPSLPLED